MFIGTYPIQRGGSPIYLPISGGLPPGVYACNSSGDLTYSQSGTVFSGVTFDSTYDIYWFEVLSDGTKTPVQSILGNVLVAGENTPIAITGAEFSATIVMWLADTFTNDFTDGNFTFDLADIGVDSNFPYTLTGGITPVPSAIDGTSVTRTYLDLDVDGEGDYQIDRFQTDPNGTVTAATGNPKVARWAPHVFIYGWRVGGGAYNRDLRDIQVSGVETIDFEYVKGYNVLTNANGSPLLDANGELQIYGPTGNGQILEELAVALPQGVTDFQILNVADNFGNSKNSWSLTVTRIPQITNNGLTTIDEETFGTTYTAVGILDIDAGLSDQILGVTPSEAPYGFNSGDHRVYNFTASYTYPSTTVSNSVAYPITYQELAFNALDDQSEFYMINDYPAQTNLDDVEEFYMINGDI